MRNIIIGTAGHIDHGKTTLVKMLTNINTDTMKEEKERGMTIDLGFAPLSVSDNENISIVDVPGHEKFIKNMVAGAKGIDFVLFLIACDDGVMPQTIEHKEILKLLRVNKGIVVLSKRDLVSKDRVENLKSEINTIFSDGFFSNFPFIEVSSKEPSTYTDLYNLIKDELSKNFNTLKEDNLNEESFRLDIDKIYSPKGVGTIVSGTSIGSIIKSDTLTLFPLNIPIKIKGIQAHGKDCISIGAHQRCALNITGINANDIERGNLLTNSKSIINSKVLDVLFSSISNDSIPKNNTKIRLHIGTGEYYGKIKYLQDNYTKDIFFQLVMDKEIPVDFNDIGILRTLSTSVLIGGIRILTPRGVPTKKNNIGYLNKLRYLAYNNLNLSEYILNKDSFISIDNLNIEFNLQISIDNLKDDIIYSKETNSIIHINNFNKLKNRLNLYLEEFHKKNPLKKGVPIATINKQFLNEINITHIFKDEYKYLDGFVALNSFKLKLTKDEKKIKDDILILLKNETFSGLNKKMLDEYFKTKLFKNIFNFLLKNNLIVNLDDIFILKGFYNEALSRLNSHFENDNSISLAQFRDLLGCSRKIALIFLEHFDKNNITKKINNYRIKY
ncbi:selenocysteine-specific translation elongation factor [Cetobacterium sp.]|uniref:selenocysteine-specific translation elongation factor n=1 Tax=Cetobacterium sp. TaxID=2071632 RepID=UPI003F3698E2